MTDTKQAQWNVAVFTDGMGAFQARCLHCSWKGPWVEPSPRRGVPRSVRFNAEKREAFAAFQAKEHGADHARAALAAATGEK